MSKKSQLKIVDEFVQSQHEIIMEKQHIIDYLRKENDVLKNAIRAVVKRSPSQEGSMCGFAHVEITAWMQAMKAYELTID